MNIQINNFGGIYGKMALAQKKRSSQTDYLQQEKAFYTVLTEKIGG